MAAALAGIALAFLVRAAVRTTLPAAPGPDSPAQAPESPSAPHSSSAPCPDGEVPAGVVERWQTTADDAESVTRELDELRALLEGRAPERPAQDPSSLEPGLIHVAGRQEQPISLESVDCSEYPCVAVFRSTIEPGRSPLGRRVADELTREPGWTHRRIGGMNTPLGDGVYVDLIAVWEDPPSAAAEERVMDRYVGLLADARRASP